MQRVTTPVPLRRVVAAEPLEIPDVVSALPAGARSALFEKRLLHGLLRFPLAEAADNRQPRW